MCHTGFDFLNGGNGDDLLIDPEEGLLFGGAGNDTIDGEYSYENGPAGVIVNLSNTAISVGGVTVAARTALDGYGDTDTLAAGAINGHGSTFSDFIVGSADGQNFFLGSGNDTVNDGGGDDLFFGGQGSDIINGGEGVDRISFGFFGFSLPGTQGAVVDLAADTAIDQFGDTDTLNSVEIVFGSLMDDTLRGDENNNSLFGGDGDDFIYTVGGPETDFNIGFGGAGNDFIRGGNGNDILRGDAGNDTLEGGGNTFVDILEGGDGDDLIIGGDSGVAVLRGEAGDDTLVGGGGEDTATYTRAATGVTASLKDGQASDDGDGGVDTLIDIDRINGSRHNDSLEGDKGGNILAGFDGNDRLDGLKGNDTLYGDNGDDTINGGKGNDLIDGGADNDLLTGGKGKDEFVFGSSSGSDVITDFSNKHDTLNIADTDTDFTNLNDVEAAATETTIDGSSGILIDLGGGNDVFLVGLDVDDLAKVDFIF